MVYTHYTSSKEHLRGIPRIACGFPRQKYFFLPVNRMTFDPLLAHFGRPQGSKTYAKQPSPHPQRKNNSPDRKIYMRHDRFMGTIWINDVGDKSIISHFISSRSFPMRVHIVCYGVGLSSVMVYCLLWCIVCYDVSSVMVYRLL